MSRNELRDIVQDNLKGKVDNPTVSYGWLGNAASVVDIPGPYGWVWVTMTDGSIQKAYDVITPHRVGYPVKCGYDPYFNNGLLKVLETWIAPMANSSMPASPAVAPHHASHEWLNSNGGNDVVYVRMRQMTPLRPEVIAPFGIYIEPDLQFINGVWTAVGGSTIDLSSYVPGYTSGSALQERFILIYMDSTSGSIVAASGSIVTSGSLAMNMVPAFTASQYPICIVHLYTAQSQIHEALVPGTDLADVRWGMFRGVSYSAAAPIHISGSSISHDTTAVTSGSYTNANITVDAMGHVTAASNGASGSGGGGSSIYPQRATLWHDEAIASVGGTVTRTIASGQSYGYLCYQSTRTNGDAFTQSFMSTSGSYTFNVLGQMSDPSAYVDWYVDNVLFASGQDWYASSTAYNVLKTVSVYIPTNGRHVLKGIINGHNPSSWDYLLNLTKYWFVPVYDTANAA